MDKFLRKYSLLIQQPNYTGPASIGPETIEIKNPLTIEFDITRDLYSRANNAVLKIYGLAPATVSRLRKDYFDYDKFWSLELRAGYGDNLPIIFKGDISYAASTRQGTVMVTTIQAYDAGFAFANSAFNDQFPSGTTNNSILTALVDSLKQVGVTPGAIGNFEGSIGRGNSYSGNATDLLSNLTGGGFFVDNGKAYCLNENECILGELAQIDADNGLLGTPVLEQTKITFDIMFEPRILVGQKINLVSTTYPEVNGEYKICQIRHAGTISDGICGSAITTCGFVTGGARLEAVGDDVG